MGTSFMESFCCINKTDVLNNENYPQNFSYSISSKADLNKSLNPMERKHLPSNEIALGKNNNSKKLLQVSTIGKMPVSSNNFIMEKFGNPCKDYELIEKLGEGTFGEVFLCKNKITNQLIAIKKIQRKSGVDETEIKQEIEILKQLNHPYILKLYEYYMTDENIYLVEEFCCEGDLSDKLFKMEIFPEFIVKIIMIQIFKALMYLSTKNIIHGDLKLENILVDSYQNKDMAESLNSVHNKDNKKDKDKFVKAIENDMILVNNELENKNKFKNNKFVLGRVDSITLINTRIYETTNNFKSFKFKNKESNSHKISQNVHNVYNSGKLEILKYGIKLIDFGCSKIFNRTKRNFNDMVGTLVYSSPEVLRNNYNYACDIWACGVIMYILLGGEYPFYGETEDDITESILSGKFSFDSPKFKGVSEEAKDLISKCFIIDPHKRINVVEVLNHPFFDDLKESKIFMKDEKKYLLNLKNQPERPKFYQMVLTYMSYHFNDKELLSDLSHIFYKIDKDSDGKISNADILIAFKEAGETLTQEELEQIMNRVDFDRNGIIEYEEFIRVLIPEDKLFTDANLRNAFALFDVNNCGFITPSQVVDTLLNDDKISNGVKQMMKNEVVNVGDEIMEFEDFRNLMFTLSMQKT